MNHSLPPSHPEKKKHKTGLLELQLMLLICVLMLLLVLMGFYLQWEPATTSSVTTHMPAPPSR